MKISVLLVCIVCALPCAAAEPLAGLLACRAITDSAARLACFDRETAALTSVPAASLAAAAAAAAPGTAAAPTSSAPAASQAAASTAAAPPAAPALDPQQAFGLSGSAIAGKEDAARPAKLAKIESRVVGLSLTGNGRTVFSLENSQMWRQLESDGDTLARLGDVATISRGLLGSYWLQLKGGRGCKVTRVR